MSDLYRNLANQAAVLRARLATVLSSVQQQVLWRQAAATEKAGVSNFPVGLSDTAGAKHMHDAMWRLTVCAITNEGRDVVHAAARSLPDDQLVWQMRPLVPEGFLMFQSDSGELRTNIFETGEILPTKAFAWFVARAAGGGGYKLLIASFVETERGYGQGWKRWSLNPEDTFASLEAGMLADAHLDGSTHVEITAALEDLRYVVAFNLLSEQRILDTSHVDMNRQLRRAAERAELPVSPIRIVHLPRHIRHHHDTEHTDREYTHRWIVSGHWRNQWYPSLDHHRLIWILPHIKGPDDKPLVVKETRYVFDP